ncbi:hypothetical protein Kpol_1050p90 [Vanderwaltozyma polyspora DSM 70294]|uniref:SURF1-like protein n=1 Tax=Vanderwaltozyma polyspora (strain ATCC 22028 / DSM 70294 / BCRC 21397 / CBS 2163 / NBRC 10782 / NRRL Y-8283 / UCD 57-17) TaxID=436907 RepID=A7TEY4_VANPO|nr:uncharacterized protein Kpol_1050p90 [Vanderwaltozyma polyspora DSM 70294]EDO19230.1 hypothetical protein Kpol_1050p90 [Vanderwaltozyma polyspora DSM 70294]
MLAYRLQGRVLGLPMSKTLRFNKPIFRVSSRRNVVTSTVDWKPIKTGRTPNEGRNKNGIGKKIVLGLMCAVPIISFYLGTWQLRRLSWKTKLIAACEDRLTYEPTPLPKHFDLESSEHWEYRKVIITGKFVHEQEMFVGPRVRNGEKGYLLFTPFIREDTGEKLLIERGWISSDKVLPQSRTLQHLSFPQGVIDITCFVRVPKKRTSLQWDKEDKNSRLWQVPDVYAMAAVAGCSPVHFQMLYDLKDHYRPIDAANNEAATGKNNSSGWSWKFWESKKTAQNDERGTGNSSPSGKNIQLLHRSNTDETVEFSEIQFAKAGVPIGKFAKIDLKNNHLQYLVTWYGLSFLSSIFLVVALIKFKGGNALSQSQLKKDKLKYAKKYM